MRLLFETRINRSCEKIRDQFNESLFRALAPPLIPFRLLRFDGCRKGDEVHIGLGVKPLVQQWVSLITFEETNAAGWSFIDEGKILPWPLSSWKHHHRVDRLSDTESLIVDDISYECSPAILSPVMKPFLWWVFSLRPKRYQIFFKE